MIVIIPIKYYDIYINKIIILFKTLKIYIFLMFQKIYNAIVAVFRYLQTDGKICFLMYYFVNDHLSHIN